jgi:hypothetical protein
VAIRTDWKIGRRAHACGACNAPFAPETPFHAAIWREGEAFRRRDLCDACFGKEAAPYSHWTTALPRPPERARVFDLSLAARFLRTLAEEAEPSRAALVHLLAVLLVRKRVIRLLDLPADAKGPRARVEFSDGSGTFDIPAPRLWEQDVEGLRGQLAGLLDLGEPGGVAPSRDGHADLA